MLIWVDGVPYPLGRCATYNDREWSHAWPGNAALHVRCFCGRYTWLEAVAMRLVARALPARTT